jgi:hypothetical protein
MVTVPEVELPLNKAVTPVGKLVTVAPVAPVVA